VTLVSLGWLSRWWHGRSLRTRLVVGSVVPLALALAVGTVVLVAIFAAGRLHEVDAQTAREADVLAQLVQTGQLPRPLPLPAGSGLLAQVVGRDGVVLASTASAGQLLPLSAAPPRSGREVLRTDDAPAYGDVPLRLRVRAERLSDAPVLLVVAAPLGDVRRAVGALRLVLLLVLPVLVALATLLARALIGSALRPVEELRTAAVRLAGGGPVPELLPVGDRDDEVGRLARTLNSLLARMHDALTRERSFVADAAHELRSPLASLRVQLDVASSHPSLVRTDELAADLQADVDRLQHLADDLLLLARLESRAVPVREPVDLAGLAPDSAPDSTPDSTPDSAPGSPPVLVLGDRAALARLVGNLVDNAERVAGQVRVSAHREQGLAVLDVDDDGPGIDPADRERVFDRWVRLDHARSRSDGGAGLGLALARAVAVAHGGDLQVQDSPLGGARLRFTLPAAPP